MGKKNVVVAEAAEVVQPPDLSLGADPGLVHPDQDLDPGAGQHPEVQDKKQMEKKQRHDCIKERHFGDQTSNSPIIFLSFSLLFLYSKKSKEINHDLVISFK